jgi:hypothetical protein
MKCIQQLQSARNKFCFIIHSDKDSDNVNFKYKLIDDICVQPMYY